MTKGFILLNIPKVTRRCYFHEGVYMIHSSALVGDFGKQGRGFPAKYSPKYLVSEVYGFTSWMFAYGSSWWRPYSTDLGSGHPDCPC